MAEKLNELLADKATLLVRENFTGVRAEWWWERRMGGGIEVCQELDPRQMARDLSEGTGREAQKVRRAIEDGLGLDDDERSTPRSKGLSRRASPQYLPTDSSTSA